MIRLVSWNMAHRRAAWAGLDDLDADVALLQEAGGRTRSGRALLALTHRTVGKQLFLRDEPRGELLWPVCRIRSSSVHEPH